VDQRPDNQMVGPGLRRAADYGWRLLLLGVVTYVAFRVLLRFELVFIALFLALILTSLLHPPVRLLSRVMPRPLALVATALGSLALLAGLVWLVADDVSNESSSLASEFRGGLDRIKTWLEGAPFHVKANTLTNLQSKLTSWVSDHRSTLINQALSEAGRIVDIVTVLALAVFCAIFFTSSGDRMWQWFQRQLPPTSRETWARCGHAAWRSFAGYTRGTILVAGANAIMVGIALGILRVPLVLPLVLLEFVASFIPLIGSPIALAVATVIALAGRGVTTAIVVLALIVVIGQIEGHVLQPFVMGWSVRLHPVAVAVCVIAGTTLAGLVGALVAVPLASIAWAVWGALHVGREPVPLPEPSSGSGPEPEPGPDPASEPASDPAE
jgi:predicted PurR-regulated permease PerM